MRLLDCLAVLAITGSMAVAGSAFAQTTPRGADRAPEAIRPFLGAWELELVGALPRRCTITFAAGASGGGRQLAVPAVCRRALPILWQVGAWSLGADGLPRLDDAIGKPVISFARAGAATSFDGTGRDRQQYRLDPKDHPRAAPRRPLSAPEQAALAASRPTLVDPATAPAPETIPGRYVMMRQIGREACRLRLETPAKAAFEGACADTGLAIFDPAGWRYNAGRLTLLARKGHAVELVLEKALWRKDPAVGAPLMLRKLEP